MDLSRFLRSRNPSSGSLTASPGPDRFLRPPPSVARALSSASSEDEALPINSEDTSNKNPRLGMYKKASRRSHLTDRRSRAANLESLRKDKRGVEKFQNRGIGVNKVESEDDEEDDEVEIAALQPPAKSSSTRTTRSTATNRHPLRAQQLSSSSRPSGPSSVVNVNSRQKRLEEFKANRAAKKLTETKKPPPFKVGVYKLETNINPDNFKWNKNQSFAFGGGKTGEGSRAHLDTTTSRSRLFSTSVTNRPSAAASTATKQQQSGKSSARAKKEDLKPRSIPFEPLQVHDVVENEPMEVDEVNEEPSRDTTLPDEPQPFEMAEENPDGLQSHRVENNEENPDDLQPQRVENNEENPDDFQPQPQSSEKESVVDPIPNENLEKTADRVDEDKNPVSTPDQPVNRHLQLMGEVGPKTSPINSHIDQIIFKTPIGITPISRMRGRSARRRTEAGLLMDSLRPEICTERGSSSDRKRRRQGLPASRTPAEILGIDDDLLFNGSSPMSEIIRSNMIDSSTSEEAASSAKLTPRKLDGDFDQIVAMDDDSNPKDSNAKESEDKTNVTETKAATIGDSNVEQNGNQLGDGEVKKDVAYFRQVLKVETDRLKDLCEIWDAKINDTIPEDVKDQILAVIGNSRLAMAKKGRFTQFQTLIDDCEFQRGEQKTTCSDLEGFWDLIYIQMEKFSVQFKELDQLEANEWKKPEPEKRKPVKRVVRVNRPKPVNMEKTAPAAKTRPPLRALIAQRRAEVTGGSSNVGAASKSPIVQISINKVGDDENAKEEEKTFQGGFFRVTTPKTPLRNSAPNTPRSNVKTNSATVLTPSRKPLSNRMSLLVMSTSKLRRSVCFDQFEKEESGEQGKLDARKEISPKLSLDQTEQTKESNPEEGEARVEEAASPFVKSTPLKRGRPKKSETTPSVHFSKLGLQSDNIRRSSPRYLAVSSALESEDSDVPSGPSRQAAEASAIVSELNATTPGHASKMRFAENSETPSSAQTKSVGRKSKNRKSLIPDLISFDTPEPLARTPNRRASRRKSLAASTLDSSVTEIPKVAILPPTPRRSTRLSMVNPTFGK